MTDNSLQYIKGIGPRKAEILNKEGIFKPSDLVLYIPRTYIDHETVPSLMALSLMLRQETSYEKGFFKNQSIYRSEVSVVARVSDAKESIFGRNRRLLMLTANDGSGAACRILFWHFQDFYKKKYPVGSLLLISGKPELDNRSLITFHHPEIEIIEEEEEVEFKSGSILPVYRISEKMRNAGLTTRLMRKIILSVLPTELPKIEEKLPDFLLSKYKFPFLPDALRNLHFPLNKKETQEALNRMKYQEIFYFEMYLAIKNSNIKTDEKAIAINPKSPKARHLYESLPFELTPDQKKVIREITDDMHSGNPMNRLLQGDVGSGKTIVAILNMLAVIDNGYQVAFLAPTEILAEQHFLTLQKLLKDSGVNIVQLVGGQKAKWRKEVLEKISSGEANIIVGTHALFQNEIEYRKLALVIIDEQHRFGVMQRASLKELAMKSFDGNEISPHILVMSATPIPRTLSMTIYGDLDVSIIKTMPKNRKPVITKISFDKELQSAFEFVRKQVSEGRQAYIVYPLVEKSEKLELKSATEHFEMIRDQIFPDMKVGLLHGQMFWYEKEETMKAFLNREFQVLVATTVIEVGIDIPNASVMMINDAHRFGLSQLHQLRGRVGRGADQSYCILVTKDNYQFEINKKGVKDEDRKSVIIRLKTMEETSDGFEIAEVDLKLRGPGDVLGTRQSGLPSFKFVDIVNDGDIITQARGDAFEIAGNDPQLLLAENKIIRREYIELYKNTTTFYDIA